MPKLSATLPLHARALYQRPLLRPVTSLTARYTSTSPQPTTEKPTTSSLDSSGNKKTDQNPPTSQRQQQQHQQPSNPDPTRIIIDSDEYSKSGGDSLVAEQVVASFQNSKTTDPALQKEQAGKGNEVNPLEVSPATPEVSAAVEEVAVERDVGESGKKGASGMGQGRKGKKVEHTQIDFKKIKMRGR